MNDEPGTPPSPPLDAVDTRLQTSEVPVLATGDLPSLGQVSRYHVLTLSKGDKDTLGNYTAWGIGSWQKLMTGLEGYYQQYEPIELHTRYGDALASTIVSRSNDPFPLISGHNEGIAMGALYSAFSDLLGTDSIVQPETQWKGTCERTLLKENDQEKMPGPTLVNQIFQSYKHSPSLALPSKGTITLCFDGQETTLDYTLDKMTYVTLNKVKETVERIKSGAEHSAGTVTA